MAEHLTKSLVKCKMTIVSDTKALADLVQDGGAWLEREMLW
jgi:hypothetical protein